MPPREQVNHRLGPCCNKHKVSQAAHKLVLHRLQGSTRTVFFSGPDGWSAHMFAVASANARLLSALCPSHLSPSSGRIPPHSSPAPPPRVADRNQRSPRVDCCRRHARALFESANDRWVQTHLQWDGLQQPPVLYTVADPVCSSPSTGPSPSPGPALTCRCMIGSCLRLQGGAEVNRHILCSFVHNVRVPMASSTGF